RNHVRERKLGRLAALDRAVELGAVDLGADIVYGDAVGLGRLGARALLDHLILQAGSGDFHALLGFVLGEKLIAGLLVGFGFGFHLGLLFAAQFFHELLAHGQRFGFG